MKKEEPNTKLIRIGTERCNSITAQWDNIYLMIGIYFINFKNIKLIFRIFPLYLRMWNSLDSHSHF